MAIGPGIQEEREHLLRVPATLDELGGEPVEQFGVEGEVSLATELFARAHDAYAKDGLPEAVHRHAGGEGVVAMGNPMREAETVLGRGVVPAGEVGWHAFVNLVAEGLPVTAELYEGLATLIGRKILHDRHGHRRGSCDLFLEAVGAGAFVLGRRRDIADVVIGEEFILGLRALLFRGVEGGLERFFGQLRSLG